jgi:ribonuclease HI
MTLIVHTDGGSRGNPGPAAAAFIITDSSGSLIKQSGSFLGVTTNNQAEYRAVLQALIWIKAQATQGLTFAEQRLDLKGAKIDFYLDSELVARQLSGQYKIKSQELLPLALQIKHLQDSLNSLNIQIFYHSIPRRLNQSADRLVNQVLDSQ